MTALSRRDFARALSLGGLAAVIPRRAFAEVDTRTALLPPPRAPYSPDERYWDDVRSRFILPADVAFINAANLCPAPLAVLQAADANERLMDVDPSSVTRTILTDAKEEARRLVAQFLAVSPEEIVLTRNTSEGNNLISSGLVLGPNDEVVIFGDNHPSNNAAWKEKAKRFGFSVITIDIKSPHPGAEYYLNAAKAAFTARTRVLAITHVTNSVGDMFPAAELCALAREHSVLSLVDGVQTFGVLTPDLSRMEPDFYTASAHKWVCGPKEIGVLYVRSSVHDRIWPSVISAYAGTIGISKKLEALGQRDDAALAALGEALRFHLSVGRDAIERRSRELALALHEGLSKLPGSQVWTSRDPSRSAAVLSARIGTLDARKLAGALHEKDRIVVTARAGEDRPGLRFSPHFYNTMAEMDRTVATLSRYLASGV